MIPHYIYVQYYRLNCYQHICDDIMTPSDFMYAKTILLVTGLGFCHYWNKMAQTENKVGATLNCFVAITTTRVRVLQLVTIV